LGQELKTSSTPDNSTFRGPKYSAVTARVGLKLNNNRFYFYKKGTTTTGIEN